MAASELAVLGTVAIEEADIVGDWSRPSFDVAASTVGVFEGDTLLGYAEVSGPGRGDAAVHPDHLGRGIGTALARWMQQKAREQGQSEIGMPVPAGSPGEKLLLSLDYRKRWESWVLVFPEGRAIEEQPLPEGYAIRIAGEADVEPAYHVVEDAFLEWSVRDKASLEDWVAGVQDRPGYEPWNLQVVTDPDGTVVGATHTTLGGDTGYVAKVAVRKDQRGRGLARGLLAAAFTSAREHGATRSELATDSRTGALDLYLGLGMEIDSTWVNYGVTL
ncbi:MAG: GNAT family N-acetyltransferase [Nocardioidaceae bacterium]|nr:GNAT family N-acetyltransferase [Nocardioidaceae bacterium]